MVATSGFRQFVILLYKGLLLRKRHYIVTFFELVIPVFVASILCIIQAQQTVYSDDSDFLGRKKGNLWEDYATYQPFDPFSYAQRQRSKVEFVFTPNNDFTRQFVNDSVEFFRRRTGYGINYTSIKEAGSEKELERYSVEQQREVPYVIYIGTVFQNFGDELPPSLDYKIRYNTRFGSNFKTQLKYKMGTESFFMSDGYSDTFFLAWQASVEGTFIQRRAAQEGKSVALEDYNVWMQKFPFPAHKKVLKDYSAIAFIPWVVCYGYLVFILNLVRRVIEEKSNGSKELMKMMGMTDLTYWSSTFLNYFLIALITVPIITIVYKATLKNGTAVLKHSDGGLIFLILLLFMISLILFCMTFSIFFNRAVFAIIVLLVVYIVSFTMLSIKLLNPFNESAYFSMSMIGKLGICLFPQTALVTAIFLISSYEASGEGVHWSNISEFALLPEVNLLMVILTMLFSCFLYAFLLWYFDAVWPWQPGVPRPFYFFLTRNYWCGGRPKQEDGIELVQTQNNVEFFETEPSNILKGVVIKNLSKEFRSGLTSKLAVNNVSLNIYHGQITALLGHNGAGKTTTINILTGLFTPTSGSASINGLDILTDTTKARRGLGVCPQHNVLFDTLTVDEHLKIYAAMKGVPWTQLAAEATKALDILKLSDKRFELAKSLSGGMKRKLSLAIAIIGGSKVLFLDEPTSGLDVEARRSVWDALLEIRRDRTIILTTHYMEEADILGDRIAIMAEGEVQCCGSPMFLKQKFGTGYHLHVVKDAKFNLKAVTSVLKKYVPEAKVGKELEKEISFSLSTGNGKNFGDMFDELEHRKGELGVLSFGVTITTMEDVFLNVADISDVKYKAQYDAEERNGVDDELGDIRGGGLVLTSYRKLRNQFIALLIKRFHYSKRHWSILIAQLAIPLLLMCMCMFSIKSGSSQYRTEYDPLKMDISSVYGETDGFYYSERPDLSGLANSLKNVLESNKVNAPKVPEPTHFVLNYGKDMAKYYKKTVVGGAIDTDSSGALNLTAWFNDQMYHAKPMALLLMHTALLQNTVKDGRISMTNAPLPELQSGYSSDYGGQLMVSIMATVFVPMALGFLSASFTLVPIHERATKAKLLQLMSGIPAVMYWTAMFLWDYLVHCIACIFMIIPYAIFAHYAFFGNHSISTGTSLLLMFLYGWSSIPFSYLASFVFSKGNAGFASVVGVCAAAGVGAASTFKAILLAPGISKKVRDDLKIATWVLRIFPTFSLGTGFSNLFVITYSNSVCESLPPEDLNMTCKSILMRPGNSFYKCCKELCGTNCINITNPLTWEENACGRDLFFLFIDGVIYFGIVLLLETRVLAMLIRLLKPHLQRLKDRLQRVDRTTISLMRQESVIEDTEVLQEEERIRHLTATQPGSSGEALVVSELTKVFKNFHAVKRLAFGIHQEECFGFLGVNGAGKTTTFRMLTGDCLPTEGNAFIQYSSLRTDLKRFQSYLGYCPQFDALIDRLTGREMLMLFGRLRGLFGNDLLNKVEKMIRHTDLSQHADKQTQFYSGGNKRKLSVALALIGTPPLILLDEPTAGVDPVSRRKIWKILAQARNNTGAAVLLTTHSLEESECLCNRLAIMVRSCYSMEESEALCNRLAIMVNGRFRCLGSIQQLKSKYGQGYTLIIKLKREDENNESNLNVIKGHIQSNLPGAVLKDDHQGMLQYHVVNPSLTLSHLFKFMSHMKIQFQLEDYLISTTSLEQIFLTFARAQRVSGE